MTAGRARADTAETADAEQERGIGDAPISVVDAVCCIHFCAAGKGGLLIDLLKRLDMEILIPGEVAAEVVNKSSMGQLAAQWATVSRSQHVKVLPTLVTNNDQDAVIVHLARIRGTSATLALSTAKDRGEAVVLAHAAHLRDQGRDTFVVIDDGGGQTLAAIEDQPLLTMDDLLMAGYKSGALTAEQVRTTYNAMRPFGSGMPSWAACELKKMLAAARREAQGH